MRQSNLPPHRPAAGRRIAGHAQEDHIPDPYQLTQKLSDRTVCRQCGAVYRRGRWQWAPRPEEASDALCSACRRINDKFPAGIVTFHGRFGRQQAEEIARLARHQEEPKSASIRSTASSASTRARKASSSIRQTFICRAGSARPANAPFTAPSTSNSKKADTSCASTGGRRRHTTGNSGPGRSGPDIM